MNENKEDAMDPWIGDSLNADVPDDVQARFRQRQDAFCEKVMAEPVPGLLGRLGGLFRLPRVAFAGGASFAAVALLVVIGLGRAEPTWAQVVESFRSVSFFNATLFYRSAKEPPRSIEVWRESSGRERWLLNQKQVVFSQRGKMGKCYDLLTRKESVPDIQFEGSLLPVMMGKDAFSLETIVQELSGRLIDTTPEVSSDPDIARDLVVFDIRCNCDDAQMIRIWALRSSRLPVRLEAWEPGSSHRIDIVFGYSKPQSAAFYSADAFARELGNTSASPDDLAYALMKDPAGRAVTKRDIPRKEYEFRKAKLEQSGMTPDGLLWIVQQTGLRAPGEQQQKRQIVYGYWEPASDDGDGVSSVVCIDQNSTNGRTLSVYAPLDYPFEARWPGEIVLACRRMRVNDEASSSTVMETSTLTALAKETMWPAELGSVKRDPRLTMARELRGRKDIVRTERLLNSIAGNAADDLDAFVRDAYWARLAFDRKSSGKADVERAHHLLRAYAAWLRKDADIHRKLKPRLGLTCGLFQPVSVLVAGGKAKEAGEIVREIVTLETPERRDMLLEGFAIILLNHNQLEPEQIDGILGEKMSDTIRFAEYGRKLRDVAKKAKETPPSSSTVMRRK